MKAPACSRKALANGLVLLVAENHRLPLVSINAFILAGKDQNPQQLPGLAALTSRLLDEGTANYTSAEIGELVESVGGQLATFSQREMSGVSLFMPAGELDLGLRLLAEILRRPSFPEERFRLEKRKVLNYLRSMQDDPQTVGAHLFDEAVYQGSPLQFPVLGRPESVKAMAVEDVRSFYRSKYAPQNTLLVVVGDVGKGEVQERVEEHFSDWEAPAFQRRLCSGFRRQERPLQVKESAGKEQVHLFLGHLGVERRHADFHALQVLDVILGNGPGFASRIPRRLRDELGLAYNTYADLTGSSGIYPGRFLAYICTSARHRERAREELIREVRTLQREGVEPAELEAAKDYLTGSYVFDMQSNMGLARFLALLEVFQLGLDYPRRYPDLIRAVTREEVERVACLYLDTVNYTTVIVGPPGNGGLKGHLSSERS